MIMKKTPINFRENIKKLKDYLILEDNPDYLIVGTEIAIRQARELLGNLFQPRTEIKDRNFFICFMIGEKDNINISKLKQFGKMPKLLLVSVEKKYNCMRLEERIKGFIKEEILNIIEL